MRAFAKAAVLAATVMVGARARAFSHATNAPPPPVINGHATERTHEPQATEAAVEEAVITVEPPVAGRAGDWRQAAQRIDAELAQYFGGPGPRH